MPNVPSSDKTSVIAVKNNAETDIKVRQSCPILLDFFTLPYLLFPGMNMFRFNSVAFIQNVEGGILEIVHTKFRRTNK